MPLEKEDLSQSFNNMLISWQGSYPEDFVPETEPRLRVNDVVSKLAFLYEKIRYTVDFKEEHLLRKNSIERILKMRILREKKDSRISKSLLQELIRGGYLPNRQVPESKIGELSLILDKYILLLRQLRALNILEGKNVRLMEEFLIGLASCELEEKLSPARKDQAMAATMYRVINDNIVIKKGHINDHDREILLYVSVYKTLLKYDQGWLEYLLWRLYVPEWSAVNGDSINDLVVKLPAIKYGIASYLKHRRLESFTRLCRKYMVLFVVIRDIYDRYPDTIYEIVTQPKLFEDKIREACAARYRQARVRLRRSAIRSIVYIFLTKMLLALFIEAPYDFYFAQTVNYNALLVNIFFPPLLMFLAALLIHVPSESNTVKIIRGVRSIVYSRSRQEIPLFLRPLERSLFLTVLFGFIYAFMFLFSFGIIVIFLQSFYFTWVSIGLFLFFLCVVSFFAFHIRRAAREMVIEGRRDRIRTVLADFLSLPFLRAGRFLSNTFSRVNVFMFILDFIIEAPFKSFIEITEELLAYIREKKEEV